MELFLIYLVTRLTDLKEGLSSITGWSGALLTAAVLLRVTSEWLTSPASKEIPVDKVELDSDAWYYHATRRTTNRGLWLVTPIFVIAFCVNMFLPTTRDAVVIAGGYGLVEAVKNERVQRLFSKSAGVASQWLDAQLNPKDKPVAPKVETPKTPAAPEKPAVSIELNLPKKLAP